MAFFKPIYKKMSKKWHPQAVSVGKPIEMDELCKQIALISTVSSADSKATLEALGLVLGSSMNTGRTVHVEGLGTFYYTCVSNGKGVDSAEKVNANTAKTILIDEDLADSPVPASASSPSRAAKVAPSPAPSSART